MDFDITFATGLVVTALLIALSSLFVLAAVSRRDTVPTRSIFDEQTPSTVFLFDGDSLVDATPAARALVSGVGDRAEEGAWFRVLTRLEQVFPGLSLRIDGLQREGRFVISSREDLDPPLMLRAESLGGLTRLTVVDGDSDQRDSGREGPADIALQDELALFRDVVTRAPALIWRALAPILMLILQTRLPCVAWCHG